MLINMCVHFACNYYFKLFQINFYMLNQKVIKISVLFASVYCQKLLENFFFVLNPRLTKACKYYKNVANHVIYVKSNID
jgi:hypothetical protein